MDVKSIFVIGGGGLMGNGIVQCSIEAGFVTTVNDIKDEFVQRGVAGITKRLERKVSKGKLTEEQKNTALGNMKTSTDLADAKDADVVIEAVFEDMELKQSVFSRLDEICPPDTIFASNSSSLPITEMAGFTKRPDKVIGMHFLQPPPVMPLTNVIRGLLTSDDTSDTIEQLAKALGKEVVQWKDGPGHGLQLAAMAYYNETARVLAEGRGTKEDIDKCFKLSLGMPMGPVTTLDFMGMDTVLHILHTLHEAYGGFQYHPAQIIVQMVKAGLYGNKTGRGFYDYR
ncbi:MAG: 3-hydroxyacyl-CoA dehydrogenase NAD-binding domain-containing protein [Chloroflexota bacterium]|nr:3-hydroxyacyl-CoA dehydrogenase NAD-binding domain-containing protein [Chloroflexota bacterium]